MSRRIYIAGRQHIVPDGVSERDVRQLADAGRDRFLAVQNPEGEGYEIFDEEQLKRKRDLNVVSLPRYRQGFDYRRERIHKEAEILSQRFPVEFDDEFPNYIAVMKFPLSHHWSQSSTTLLIKIPEKFPETPPIHFFMKQSLTYRGISPSHYFKDTSYNELSKKGWGKYCLHIKGKWRPSNEILDGDNLISYLELIKVVLDNMEREKV